MPSPDWSRADDYAFTERLDAPQWAWEFLRRNPEYRSQWQRFDSVWRQLEADYGRPPDRDFCAWKRDPRAWVHADACSDGECRVDQDKVLIECAFGARWGFHKFPPAPTDDDPVGGQRLAWRERSEAVPLLGRDDAEWLGDEPARVAIGFDLALPLRDQVERAKRLLQMLQRQRLRAGAVTARSIAAQRDTLRQMLRLLDAEAAGESEHALAAIDAGWERLLREARRLRDGAYRDLAFLPE